MILEANPLLGNEKIEKTIQNKINRFVYTKT